MVSGAGEGEGERDAPLCHHGVDHHVRERRREVGERQQPEQHGVRHHADGTRGHGGEAEPRCDAHRRGEH